MNLTEKQKNSILNALIEDAGTQNLLKSLIEKELTPDPYIEACAKLGIAPKPELSADSDNDDIWADAIKRLSICIRAFNMVDGKEWQRVYDGSEYHYVPIAKPDPSGSGWAYVFYVFWGSDTGCGPRLEYRSGSAAEEGFAKFNKYYQIVLSV